MAKSFQLGRCGPISDLKLSSSELHTSLRNQIANEECTKAARQLSLLMALRLHGLLRSNKTNQASLSTLARIRF